MPKKESKFETQYSTNQLMVSKKQSLIYPTVKLSEWKAGDPILKILNPRPVEMRHIRTSICDSVSLSKNMSDPIRLSPTSNATTY